MKVIIGLGNPGLEYENTYHNVGEMAVQAMASSLPWKVHKKVGRDIFLYAASEDGTKAFVVPLLFMNRSGMAAKEALKKFRAAPKDAVVIHDESDLPVGKFKISEGRGAAGHKGVQSIVDALGTNDFTRIRIGIRNPREKERKKAGEFVLKKISARDRAALDDLFSSLPL